MMPRKPAKKRPKPSWDKRGGARTGAGRKKIDRPVKIPAGRPTNPELSTIEEAYYKIDCLLSKAVDTMGIILDTPTPEDKNEILHDKNRLAAAKEILGKRLPTATATIDLTEARKTYSDEELAAMSFEELLAVREKMVEGRG